MPSELDISTGNFWVNQELYVYVLTKTKIRPTPFVSSGNAKAKKETKARQSKAPFFYKIIYFDEYIAQIWHWCDSVTYTIQTINKKQTKHKRIYNILFLIKKM